MDNPFIMINDKTKTEYLSHVCSLNRGVMAKVPLKGIEDSIEGMTFQDIFSTKSIVEGIKEIADKYNINARKYVDSYLPLFVEESLLSDEVVLRNFANAVVNKFGNRLGLIFLTLKLGEKENRDARDDWTEEHWEYWKNIDNIILVGGLASNLFGRRLKEQIYYIFDQAGVKPYNITLFDNATFVGVQGCAQYLAKDNATSLVFDFGHTNIKRCIVEKKHGRIVVCKPLESVPSKYMKSKFETEEEKFKAAITLHKLIVKIITNTYKETMQSYELSDEIVMSIANYNSKGFLNKVRGGYAKLSLLGEDYEKLLSEEVSSELHKKVVVKLLHDGTSNALYFSDVPNSICISIGTAFGVGFPQIKI